MSAGILYMVLAWGYLMVAVVAVYIMERRFVKREKAKVRAAQDLELEEGVTLLRAVRAYYGEDGRWVAARDLVYVFAGSSRSRRGELWVSPETGEVVVCKNGRKGDKAESAALVEAMVQAARRGERGPWP